MKAMPHLAINGKVGHFQNIMLTHWPLGDLNEILDIILKLILVIDCRSIFCQIVPCLMSLDLTDDKSTLVQVMAWCHQATSHYLSQCWPRSMSPYGISKPQWVKSTISWLTVWPYGINIIIGPGNGASPVRCQAIPWTNALIFCQLDLRNKFDPDNGLVP